MAIRWDKKYTKRVQRIVSNFNKRLEYQQSYGRQYLPDKTSMAYIRDVFTSRRDLNRYLRQLERFNVRTSQIVKVGTDRRKMTLWEKQNLISDRASARYKAKQRMRSIIQRQGSRLRNFERGEEYLTLEREVKKLSRPLSKLSTSQLFANERLALKYRERAKRTRMFKARFLEMLVADSTQAGTNPEQIARIGAELDKLEPEQLLALYNDNRNIKYIVEHYKMYRGKKHDLALDDNGKALLKTELDIIEATIAELVEKYATM